MKKTKKKKREKQTKPRLWLNRLSLFFLFLLALIPRLYFIFVVSQPIEIPLWYGDVFHHWQIAYLSKEIGFKQGFLRLWDLKGMEYFWGLMHPLVLAILFKLTGSANILIPRLLSTVCGSASIVLLYSILKREFNWQAGLASAIFASFFPISIFNNSIGMQEELGIFLILLGIFNWPKSPGLTGLFFGLAAMERGEFWLFTLAWVGVLLIREKNFDKRIILGGVYFVLNLLYIKYLAFWTGNGIYPLYWNFLASVKGEWFIEAPIVGYRLVARQVNRGLFFFGLLGILWTFFKKPKGLLLFLFGFTNIFFLGFMLGFGAYIHGFETRIWTDRLYNWPYLFCLVLLFIFLFDIVPRKASFWHKIKFNWLLFALILGLSWQTWRPINYFWKEIGLVNYQLRKEKAARAAQYYQGGGFLISENDPILTYFLTAELGVPGDSIRGQMFDAFFYAEEDPFQNWGEFKKKFRKWLVDEDIKLIYLSSGDHKELYEQAVEKEPGWFELLESNSGNKIYRVTLEEKKD